MCIYVGPSASNTTTTTTTTQSGNESSQQSDDEAAKSPSNENANASLSNTPDLENDSFDESLQVIPIGNTAENVDVSDVNPSADCAKYDLGEWINKPLTSEQRSQILKHCWIPQRSYDFSADSTESNRKFLHEWLNTYAPWLAYSKKMKGALCLYCVLFRQNVVRGVLGAFVTTAFSKYKDLHDACKNHQKSQWHVASLKAAKSFTDAVPVDAQMISGHQKLIEENRKIIKSMISNVIFCGTTDSPLRGKDKHTGIYKKT